MINALYRGKRADNGEWVYGNIVLTEDKAYILPDIADFTYGDNGNRIRIGCFVEVVPETVGQWTGMNDEDGIKIFEGDIIECDLYNAMVKIVHRKYLIIFENGAFAMQWRIGNDKYSNYLHETWGRKIIGNIHDNFELLG